MPVNALIVRGLLNLYAFYGDDFTVECPTGSGKRMTLFEVAQEITRRLASIFLRDASGRRPVYGGTAKFQDDPHWRDLILFYEYFHGDNGAGLGASHQTGWTGVDRAPARSLRPRAGRGRAGDAEAEARGAPGPGAGPWDMAKNWQAAPRRRSPRRAIPRYSRSTPACGSRELAAALGRAATLDDIPDAELDRLAARRLRPGLVPRRLADRRGRRARVSRSNPEWLAEYRRTLPDFREDDVCGSPFAVARLPRARATSAATRRWPGCASGCGSAACG